MMLRNTIKVYSEYAGFTISKAHDNDAGFDLKTPIDFVLRAKKKAETFEKLLTKVNPSWCIFRQEENS